ISQFGRSEPANVIRCRHGKKFTSDIKRLIHTYSVNGAYHAGSYCGLLHEWTVENDFRSNLQTYVEMSIDVSVIIALKGSATID
ncbi:hypothetical protein J6590_015758, partial [Homalodisca vitripennis]